MRRYRIPRGLDVEITGRPASAVEDGPPVRRVAVRASDVRGLRARPCVEEGARVRLGDALVSDRDRPEVVLTAPGAGRVVAVHRGDRRALVSVVVELEGDDEVVAPAVPRDAIATWPREQALARLLASGAFARLRTRPFGLVPDPRATPRSVFVTATATDPLAVPPAVAVADDPRAFADGLAVLSRLTPGPVHLCVPPEWSGPTGDGARVQVTAFDGPHPAGLVGTHVDRLDPVADRGEIWYVGAQDALELGALVTTGRSRPARVVAIGGPNARRPRLVRTRRGASVDDLLAEDRVAPGTRVVSGSVLSGDLAAGPTAFLGTFHTQVAALPSAPRPAPGRPVLLPLPVYERVVPLDVPVVPLLRALLVGDAETAEALGVRALEEEDLALCGFVCPAGLSFGSPLRAVLDALEARR